MLHNKWPLNCASHICPRPAAALLSVSFPPGCSVMEQPPAGMLPVPWQWVKDLVNYWLALKAFVCSSVAELRYMAKFDVSGK